MFKNITTQLLKSAFLFVLAFSTSYFAGAQCNPSNPLTTGSPTGIASLAQSFTTNSTCGNGSITDIAVWAIGSHTNVTLKIYSGVGCSGTLLHTQPNVDIANGMGLPTNIDVTPNVPYTAGGVYTFKLEFEVNEDGEGGSSLQKSIADTYPDGNYFIDPDCAPTTEDLFFMVFTVAGIFPVELTDFQVRMANDQAQLQWSTASEQNNAGFEVERSTDAHQWEVLTFVEGKGTTTEVTDYQYIDKHPAVGTNYYRLRQLDFNGEESYSPVKAVEYSADGNASLAIYPNPVQAGATLNLSGIAENVEAIWLTDLFGRIVWAGNSFEGGKANIALPNDLSGGLYSLMVIAEGQKTVLKVVVQ